MVVPLDNGDMATDESYVKGLPLIGRARQLGCWSEKAVDAAGVMAGRLGLGFSFDLHFIASADIDAAVCVFAAVELDMQFKVAKLAVSDDFRPVAGLTILPSFTVQSWAVRE